MIPPYQVHSSKINGAVVNLRAKGDKLGVSEASLKTLRESYLFLWKI